MNRTKWMRLSVRDLGDIIRWAGAQNAREIGEFRYRMINGREIVSFRLVPRYEIDIGAREIIVVAYARARGFRAQLVNLRRIVSATARRRLHQLATIIGLPSPAMPLPAYRIARLESLRTAVRPLRR